MNAQVTDEIIQQIKLSDLQADPDQPRSFFDKDSLQELADDITARGIIEPIIFFKDNNGKNTITDGERRYRAAKLAKLETVPCLYRDSGTDLERLLDQVSANFQREGLNSIEMAVFFEQLIEKHKIKPSELSELLVKYGFKKFDRSYISNIRRLLKLPKVAHSLIQQNKITAAHGKYLLQALPSKPVMKQTLAFLKKHACTTSLLQEKIEDAYEELHIDASHGKYLKDENGHSTMWQTTKFDYKKLCINCKTSQIIKAQHSTSLYCLNEECYDKKQAAAKKKIEAAENRKTKVAAKKLETELIERAEQQGISIDELKLNEEKQTPEIDNRANARISRTQDYLDERLRGQLDAHMLEDEAARYHVVLWLAVGAPGDFASARCIDIDLDCDDEAYGIDITLQQKLDPKQLELMACTAGINTMDRPNLRTLAHHVGIKLEKNYSIDREYLKIKLKDEIIETTPEAVIQSFDDGEWEKTCKKSAGFIIDRILTRDHIYGVPQDLIDMYNEASD